MRSYAAGTQYYKIHHVCIIALLSILNGTKNFHQLCRKISVRLDSAIGTHCSAIKNGKENIKQ